VAEEIATPTDWPSALGVELADDEHEGAGRGRADEHDDESGKACLTGDDVCKVRSLNAGWANA
jgi:hypothetical protein